MSPVSVLARANRPTSTTSGEVAVPMPVPACNVACTLLPPPMFRTLSPLATIAPAAVRPMLLPLPFPETATLPSVMSLAERTATTLPALMLLPAPMVKRAPSASMVSPLFTVAPSRKSTPSTASSLSSVATSASPNCSPLPAFRPALPATSRSTRTSPSGALTVASPPALARPIRTPVLPVTVNALPAPSWLATTPPPVLCNCRSPPAVSTPIGISSALTRRMSLPALPSSCPPGRICIANEVPSASWMLSRTVSWMFRPVRAVRPLSASRMLPDANRLPPLAASTTFSLALTTPIRRSPLCCASFTCWPALASSKVPLTCTFSGWSPSPMMLSSASRLRSLPTLITVPFAPGAPRMSPALPMRALPPLLKLLNTSDDAPRRNASPATTASTWPLASITTGAVLLMRRLATAAPASTSSQLSNAPFASRSSMSPGVFARRIANAASSPIRPLMMSRRETSKVLSRRPRSLFDFKVMLRPEMIGVVLIAEPPPAPIALALNTCSSSLAVHTEFSLKPCVIPALIAASEALSPAVLPNSYR